MCGPRCISRNAGPPPRVRRSPRRTRDRPRPPPEVALGHSGSSHTSPGPGPWHRSRQGTGHRTPSRFGSGRNRARMQCSTRRRAHTSPRRSACSHPSHQPCARGGSGGNRGHPPDMPHRRSCQGSANASAGTACNGGPRALPLSHSGMTRTHSCPAPVAPPPRRASSARVPLGLCSAAPVGNAGSRARSPARTRRRRARRRAPRRNWFCPRGS